MANVKITELTAATALAGTDVLPIVDVGAETKTQVSSRLATIVWRLRQAARSGL